MLDPIVSNLYVCSYGGSSDEYNIALNDVHGKLSLIIFCSKLSSKITMCRLQHRHSNSAA